MINHTTIILHTFNVEGIEISLKSALSSSERVSSDFHVAEYDQLAEALIPYARNDARIIDVFFVSTIEDLSRLTGTSCHDYNRTLISIKSYLSQELSNISSFCANLYILEPFSVNSNHNNSLLTHYKSLQHDVMSYIIDLSKESTAIKLVKLPCTSYNYLDPRLFYYASLPFGKKTNMIISEAYLYCRAKTSHPKPKLIAFDLDNTIWGGVVGEDGVENLALGPVFPGNLYIDIQSSLLRLKNSGVMLAAISKNNKNDALSGFKHPKMILKQDDLLSFSPSWQPKYISIQQILKQFNLSNTSIFFLDDSDLEREEIRQHLPFIDIINKTSSPLEMLQSLIELELPFNYTNTIEDITRASSYAAIASAERNKSNYNSKEEYLTSLKLELKSEIISKENCTRALQLINKTNQFNLTSLRLEQRDLLERVNSTKYIYRMISLSDKYTNHGNIGLFGFKIMEQQIEIDHFLLSCRVLGRDIEIAAFQYLVKLAKGLSTTLLISHYMKTEKSTPCSQFYKQLGFEVSSDTETKVTYCASIDKVKIKQTPWINLISN